ncbi:MAG TPA: PAAR domain-containing protein [Kineosporiaceae bacterium]|nr:PAAR domain-containing protein [Kineosporiaceae bacterium]
MPPAARSQDLVTGTDTHIVLVPTGPTVTPTPTPLPFSGPLTQSLSTDVLVNGLAAATVGSVAVNQPPHVPPNGTFATPPKNQGTVQQGSPTVFIGGQAAARQGDPVLTCNDPTDAPNGTVAAGSADVMFG